MNLNEMRREKKEIERELRQMTDDSSEALQYKALRLYVQAKRAEKQGGEVVLRDKGGQITYPM